jgi:lactoylglutathione lyase
MADWAKDIAAITLFAEDLDEVKGFYRDVFDLPVLSEDADSVMFKLENTMLFLTRSDAAGRMIGPATAGGPGAGPRTVFAIIVADVDAVCADLVAKGVVLINGPADRSWGMRTANLADPAGHVWEIAQELPANGA